MLVFNMNPEVRWEQNLEGSSSSDGGYGCKSSPLPGEPASPQNIPASPSSGLTEVNNLHSEQALAHGSPPATFNTDPYPDSNLGKTQPQKRYIGVRVRLPVKDMLRKIRIANGVDPTDLQETPAKGFKPHSGYKRRVYPNSERRNRQNKLSAKSLEVLDMLVEVLEEDLRTSKSNRHKASHGMIPDCVSQPPYPDPQRAPWKRDCTSQACNSLLEFCPGSGTPPSQSYYLPSDFSPASSPESLEYHASPSYEPVQSPVFTNDCTEETLPAQHCYRAEPLSVDYQVPSPSSPESVYHSPHSPMTFKSHSPYDLRQDMGVLSFFQFQLQREESLLSTISDQELFAVDKCGNTLLHRAVCQGKRAQVHALAQRMMNTHRIDDKDASERTALHLAALKNQHLMVADLISLGANINEQDKFGKTPLHLCAANGYVRVLEMLKNAASDGAHVDMEAVDHSGLTPLNCAVIAFNKTVRELEKAEVPSNINFLTLKKDQLLDGIEYLLEMGAHPSCPDPVSGRTAMHFAQEENNVDLIHLFQSRYPKTGDLLKEDYALCTMLDVMSNMGSLYSSGRRT
ncbi:NF-kappa-B inhibitor zeta isoform X2 [Polyodon spathula]|uniref:NF-kappa-B inhibitor zeta isoform X2 n=1 Tax=Polyodon spathula TaxID=7913 RepID=UPI001B7E3307|nr:NF-kappa-B inhibitor zeta isoform X2 [Polyodon spathula]